MLKKDVYLPSGTYASKLLWIKVKQIDGEDQKVHFLSWEVIKGPHKGAQFWTTFWPKDWKKFPTRMLGKAMGLKKVGQKFNLVGHSCQVTIEQTRPPYHNGIKYEPIP